MLTLQAGFPNSVKGWGEIPPTGGTRNFAGGNFFSQGGGHYTRNTLDLSRLL